MSGTAPRAASSSPSGSRTRSRSAGFDGLQRSLELSRRRRPPRTSRARRPTRRRRRSTAPTAGPTRSDDFVATSCGWPFTSCVTGWSWPSTSSQLIGLDVDEREVRMRLGDGLEVVERRAALRAGAELGRRKGEHERLPGSERIGDRCLVERLDRLLVGRDLRHVAADVVERRRVGRRRLLSPTANGRRRVWTWNCIRIVSAWRPGGLGRELGAPDARLRQRRRSAMYMPRSSWIAQMNSPSAVVDRRLGVRARL